MSGHVTAFARWGSEISWMPPCNRLILNVPACPPVRDHAMARQTCCPGITRRSFLADTGMGLTGLALGAMMARAEDHGDKPRGSPHLVPKAKHVIWLFMCGGVSHVESFDVKPELNKYAGKSIDDTP